MKQVLIVDDASTVRLYYRSILEANGFCVREAANGVEGLERALDARFDLIVVDVNMPKMDGYTLVRALREEAATAAVPTLMISTEAQHADECAAFSAGANVYLVKPVAPALLGTLAAMLTAHEQPGAAS